MWAFVGPAITITVVSITKTNHLKSLLQTFHIYLYRVFYMRAYVLLNLSYDVASGSKITPCNKIDKPLVVYIFTGNVMTSITTLRT